MAFHLQSMLNSKMDSATVRSIVRCFEEEYPFLQISNIGKSILGKEIPVIILGRGKQKLLYVGAHHGMEWITANLLLCFVDEFCKLYQFNRKIDKIQIETLWNLFSIHIVPMLNPDGVDYQIHGVEQDNPLRSRVIGMNGGSEDFGKWQANARGVDLNHNYNAGFNEYKKLEKKYQIACGAPTRFSGQMPESEPEVRALCNYIRFHLPLAAVFSFHTQGEELFWSTKGKCIENKKAAVEKIALQCGYQLSEATGLSSYGGLTDWCIESCHVPAITFECGKGENPLPVSQLPSIYAKLRKTLFFAPVYF